MKYYSEFNKEYVNDICTEMQKKGVLPNKVKNLTFEPQNFSTFTKFLQEHIVMSQDTYTYLNDLGLVNRGRCPYTGQKIDRSFPSWSFSNRRVYVSHEGYKIMQKEDDEEYERIMGVPAPPRKVNEQSKSGGCYIATACYGNEFAPQVIALKHYRDETLSKSILGRLFIKAYYFFSPPIADKLKNATKLNSFVREKILNKIVNKIK